MTFKADEFKYDTTIVDTTTVSELKIEYNKHKENKPDNSLWTDMTVVFVFLCWIIFIEKNK